MHPRPGRLRAALLPLSLLLLIFGAKLVVIDHYGTDLPFWDQWAKEGELLYAPWFEQGALWHNLFQPHNEHRIVPTLALNLTLVIAGGQWDARVQCVVNAVLDAAVAVGLFVWARRRLSQGWGYAVYAACALLYGLPLVWDNVLVGFQSQYYFLIGFSLLAIHGLTGHRAFSPRWFLGLVAGLAACVSMGSGFLFTAAVAAACAVRMLRQTRLDLRPGATLAVSVVLCAAAWLLRPHAPWHEPIHAQTIGDFGRYFVHCMAWPLPEQLWLAVVFWVPWLWTTARWLRSRKPEDDALFVVAGGLWVLVQIAAVTYSRGVGGGVPADRYGSIMTVGLLFNGICMVFLVRDLQGSAVRACGGFVLLTVACAAVYAACGMLHNEIPERAGFFRAGEHNVREYVRTKDMHFLDNQRIPFPIADWLARILDRPSIRKLLPASVNEGARMSEFSRAFEWISKTGWIVAGLGALMATATAVLAGTEQRPRG
jgi:hypothetical protein